MAELGCSLPTDVQGGNEDFNGVDSGTALWNRPNEMKLAGQLRHLRTWMSKLQQKVYQLDPTAVKNSMRLYVGGLPLDGVDEAELKTFLQNVFTKAGIAVSPGSPIVGVRLNKEKGFAFVELRSTEETSNALALHGLKYQDSRLKIKRPSNYDEDVGILLGPTTPDAALDLGGLDLEEQKQEQNMEKLFVGGLPSVWGENEVKELLLPFGELRDFTLVRDKQTGHSKGYAFCEFLDHSVSDTVIKQLNVSCVASRILTVKRALEGSSGEGGGKRSSNSSNRRQTGAPSGSGALYGTNSSGMLGSLMKGGGLQPQVPHYAAILPSSLTPFNSTSGMASGMPQPRHSLPDTHALSMQPNIGLGGASGMSVDPAAGSRGSHWH